MKLFKQIGGTYQLFPIHMDIVLICLSIVPATYLAYRRRVEALPFMMVLGINAGYLIIGRYNQTAIIFTLFFNGLFWLLMTNKIKHKHYLILLLIILQLNVSIPIVTMKHDDYNALSKHFKLEGRILGNLNMDYHLDNGQLIDYRNLWYIEDFEMYIKKHDIKYIMLSEEMSYIHQTSPKWDILYGPLPYYDDMMRFLESCELVDTFNSKTYGMRIARYVDTYPWEIKIYKVPD